MLGCLYIFIDEGGNLDFSLKGTKYFTLTALSKLRPFNAGKQLCDLKYDLIETGVCLERFHATEDKQMTRDLVFKIIAQNLSGCCFDSVIVEKSKTHLSLRIDAKFYPKVLGHLLKHVLNAHPQGTVQKVVIMTDRLPIARNRNAIEKTVKQFLSILIKSRSINSYEILHHPSCSSFELQIVDYVNWAIYRKWEHHDYRSLNHILTAVVSQSELPLAELDTSLN